MALPKINNVYFILTIKNDFIIASESHQKLVIVWVNILSKVDSATAAFHKSSDWL